jgi:hypothetical protein
MVAGGDLVLLGNDAVEGRIPLPVESPRALAACGDVWLGAGRLFRLRRSELAVEPGAPGLVQSLGCSMDGQVVAGARDGLYLGKAGGPWRQLIPETKTRRWAVADIRATGFDEQGRLWFASPQGAGFLHEGQWTLFTGEDGLPAGDFTSFAAAAGRVWMGTKQGLLFYDAGQWRYRQGPRWLPGDHVRTLAAAPDGVWIVTQEGLTRIFFQPMTLAEKARHFEDEIDRRHRRTPFGYVHEVVVERPGDATKFRQTDSDNDGLWTGMYGAGACFGCAATRDPRLCEKAKAAFEALRFLGEVTQGGPHSPPPGFVARTILPGNGPDPNQSANTPERDLERQRTRDSLWKVMRPRWPKSADGRWYWKSDTSSDELDGHYFLYGLYYDLVAGDDAERQRVRRHVEALTDHLLQHHFRLIDHDGKVTRWGVFDPETLNGNSLWWEERGLNSLSMLTYLRVAGHITGHARYEDAARVLVERHGYAMNLMYPKAQLGAGTANQSDDEMAFMNYYHLLKYETNPRWKAQAALSLRRYWELERWERNPLFQFIAEVSLRGLSFEDTSGPIPLTIEDPQWRADAIDTLRRIPLDRFNWPHRNSHRLDVQTLTHPGDGASTRGHLRKDGKVLPFDEQFVMHWNHDPWRLDQPGDGRTLGDGAVFLLPYYMGLYYRLLGE